MKQPPVPLTVVVKDVYFGVLKLIYVKHIKKVDNAAKSIKLGNLAIFFFFLFFNFNQKKSCFLK